MKLAIVAVGRFGAKDPERLLFETYAARLKPPLEMIEVEERRLTGAARQKREGELLLGAVPAGAAIVAMDGRGEVLSSEALAARLDRFRDQGVGRLAFLIGGADGHDEPVRSRAAFCYSFGAATWPHLMVRAMLAEQLYRAGTILDGHPYHRA
ncbi:23S rRNA (pseudouridine(1915)-N(3))-methyltransferase RlmH [Zavarzinia compransoris]|uniref:Ribosomal RNA large subunit methyltransferase H n=1 Tax=Zavarzinia compransoris TaxID=1264899 RepID=A0A317E7C5_9PROT|nr:23S rRNA (pseudouridine(1915)-N(3))-methyltransferase RlmH [Zavarzinia compransoris]PWR22402.1 23S rRNA (pseudouridine(1915)-N(3))-methyltransferase RlmH [Zavarzinia compransoris]